MEEEFYRSFEDTKVLIVGGAGFVGSNLARLLVEKVEKVEITIVDNLLSSEITNLPNSPKVRFMEGSITDFRILSSLGDDLDYVFHLATFHGNQSSIYDPVKDHENNVMTTLMLFERLKDLKKIKKVVYSSAGCSVAKKTFGKAAATTEEDPIELHQDSPYSISKIIGEFYSVYYHKQWRLPVVRARFQNVYGPGEVLGAGSWRGTYATIWRNVTPTFIYKALTGQEIPLENEGVATRDFIFVEDICRGLMLCALKGEAGDVYNLGTGREVSIAELAEKIVKLSLSDSSVRYLPRRSWDNSGKRFASTEKAKQILGFEAKIDIEQGLYRTIEWTKQNRGVIDRCIEKHREHLRYMEKRQKEGTQQ